MRLSPPGWFSDGMLNQRRFRQVVLLLHQYAGFAFAVYLIVVCVSGAILVLLENQISDYRDYPMENVPVQKEKVTRSRRWFRSV